LTGQEKGQDSFSVIVIVMRIDAAGRKVLTFFPSEDRMMTLGEWLRKNKDAIVRRWLDDALATYPGDSSAAFKRQKDPFANPVGHSLRTATREILQALLEGKRCQEPFSSQLETHADDNDRKRFLTPFPLQCLHEIIKIRAVQQFSASQAVGFVFQLKQAIRAELGGGAGDPRFLSELAEFEERIDRIALAAFDIYTQCREQVFELRMNEVKRTVSWVVDKMRKRGYDPELAELDPE